MASKKQRRRRQKLQRHEYEYVIETDEGEEVLESPRATEGELRNGKGAKRTPAPVDRRGKPVQKPSFQRVLRRTALFAPLMALVIYFLVKDEAENVVATVFFQTALLVAFFMPFSYVVDSFMYRMFLRRQERERAARKGR